MVYALFVVAITSVCFVIHYARRGRIQGATFFGFAFILSFLSWVIALLSVGAK